MADSLTVYYRPPDTPSEIIPLLEIPVAHLPYFSLKPYKWILYAMVSVLGCDNGRLHKRGGGELATEDLEDINMEDTHPSPCNLVFIPSSDIKFIDNHGLDHLESSQFTTESRDDFKADVAERDGGCVMWIHDPIEGCDACHLIPHSKGSEYIKQVSIWRNRYGEHPIEDINDIRNGILLGSTYHRVYDNTHMATLRTPNVSLKVEDVPSVPGTQENVALRYTPHYIPADYHTKQGQLPDLHHPENLAQWPPNFLWDFIYGITIFKHYGKPSDALEEVIASTSAEYYPEGYLTSQERNLAQTQKKRQIHDEQVREQEAERAAKRAEGGIQSMDAMDIVFGLWMHTANRPEVVEARKRAMAEMEEKGEAERKQKAASVDAWRRDVQ